MNVEPSRARRVWGEAWRLAVAAVVGVLLWLISVAIDEVTGYGPGDVWPYLDLVIGLLSLPLLLLRRRRPVPVTAVLLLATAVAASPSGASLIAMVSLCTRRRSREILPMTVLMAATGVTFSVVHPNPEETLTDRVTSVVFGVLVIGFCVALGLFIGARRELVRNLHERAVTAEREQAMRVAQAQIGERSRIAREMHDVVAHRISLVAMQSGALEYCDDLSREEVLDSARVIRQNAHHALTELRQVLGVLRTEPGTPPGPEAPQPVLADVTALVQDARHAGMTVSSVIDVDPDEVPEAVSRHAYRIAQEALTNARKHAPDQPVSLRIAREDGRLVLDVRNPVGSAGGASRDPMPPSGLGLIGLTERAVLSGGELRYGVDRHREFAVSAWLPWERHEP